jgi:hypothetical protein
MFRKELRHNVFGFFGYVITRICESLVLCENFRAKGTTLNPLIEDNDNYFSVYPYMSVRARGWLHACLHACNHPYMSLVGRVLDSLKIRLVHVYVTLVRLQCHERAHFSIDSNFER